MKVNYEWKLYTDEQYNNSKWVDIIPTQCAYCGKKMFKTKFQISHAFLSFKKYKLTAQHICCSSLCYSLLKETKKSTTCIECGKLFYSVSKHNQRLCSQSCAGTYRNNHKTHGTRRSKLEKWIEEKLTQIYPTLNIQFNKKDIINSELDIFIPTLKLAFELNGIYHYEPIHGDKLLGKIQNNDSRKFQACIENGIELCIIDTSQQKYFKPQKSEQYLTIITNIINKKTEGQGT